MAFAVDGTTPFSNSRSSLVTAMSSAREAMFYTSLVDVGHIAGATDAGLLRPENQRALADHHLADAVAVEAELLGDDGTEPADLEVVGIDGDEAVAGRGLRGGLELVTRLHDGDDTNLGLVHVDQVQRPALASGDEALDARGELVDRALEEHVDVALADVDREVVALGHSIVVNLLSQRGEIGR